VGRCAAFEAMIGRSRKPEATSCIVQTLIGDRPTLHIACGIHRRHAKTAVNTSLHQGTGVACHGQTHGLSTCVPPRRVKRPMVVQHGRPCLGDTPGAPRFLEHETTSCHRVGCYWGSILVRRDDSHLTSVDMHSLWITVWTGGHTMLGRAGGNRPRQHLGNGKGGYRS
jgi:hypothetical protein